MDHHATHRRIPADELPALAQRYRSGESLASIGPTYGVSGSAARKRLKTWAVAVHGAAWFDQLVTDSLRANLRAAQAKLDSAGATGAREEEVYWQWMIERRRPKTVGSKHKILEDRTPEAIIRVPLIDEGQS